MADSLGELLEAGRWEKALFTTYSLSLTFFESAILRAALRKVECRKAWVVIDVDEYRSSLTERGSCLFCQPAGRVWNAKHLHAFGLWEYL
jgi:hypothetical protein